MTTTLRVGLSTCPNDTFIFHALLERLVAVPGCRVEPVFEDVETLNQLARDARLEVTKISFHAYGHLRERYRLLDAGAALGRGCGPLVVERPRGSTDGKAGAPTDLAACRIAIPGRWTSAALLLRLHTPSLRDEQLVEMPFDAILGAVADGSVDAGLIIHESRFTFADYGLVARVDLGDWWESQHGHPIPLGGIIARRDLGSEVIRAFDRALHDSVVYAREHPDASREFVRQHAQELDDDVTRAHIDLYVNDFTVDLGAEGHAAVDHLFAIATREGIIPACSEEAD